jgi:hypothetical protein
MGGEAPSLPPALDPASLQGMPGTGGGAVGEKMAEDKRTVGEVLFGPQPDAVEIAPMIDDFTGKIDALAAMARQLNGGK